MKILLVHPDDSVEVGPWAETRWDLAIDLGWSGRHAYSQQTERLGFQVSSIYDLLDHEQHRSRLRDLLALGLDRVVDSESIDWWEAFSVVPQSQLEQLIVLSALAQQFPPHSDIWATRPHFAQRALSLLLNRGINSFLREKSWLEERSRRYLKAAFALRPSQVAEIAFDKWDADYRLRRHLTRSFAGTANPAILLPSSYGNVSRAQMAYVRMLPHRRFLLVVTRRSGRIPNLPSNVDLRSLASYAPRFSSCTEKEYSCLLERWRDVQNNLVETSGIFRLTRDLHVLAGFAKFLKRGLRVRDAWREVFNVEPISAVLSADEYNPYTRFPILLARSRKLRTVFCDHGALNMSFGFRRPVSDVYLVQGEMARDYYVGWCGVPADKVIAGGPAEALKSLSPPNRTDRDWIVFYSEAYELSSGRTKPFYAELMPELCWLARQTNRKVIVKLHPFESRRVRRTFIDRALSAEERRLVEIREGPMTPEFFARAWCSLTVESSVAVESTLNGVPCFLCDWFDASWYDYGKQFAKYSAGYPLASPQQIREIPRLLEQIQITESTRQQVRTSITMEHLDSLLDGR